MTYIVLHAVYCVKKRRDGLGMAYISAEKLDESLHKTSGKARSEGIETQWECKN